MFTKKELRKIIKIREKEMERGLFTSMVTGEPKEDFTAYHIYEEAVFYDKQNRINTNTWNDTPDFLWLTIYNMAVENIKKDLKL